MASLYPSTLFLGSNLQGDNSDNLPSNSTPIPNRPGAKEA
jgi:hypothetical protein